MRGLNTCFGLIRTIGLIWSLLLVSLLFCSRASAADYIWTARDTNGTGAGYTGSSPTAAATSYFSATLSSAGGASWSLSRCTRQNDSLFFCYALHKTASFPNGYQVRSQVSRTGDSCPDPDATYNSQTGECDKPEPDPCESTIGQIVEHRHRAGEFTATGSIGGRTEPPGSVCLNQCQFASTQEPPTGAYRFENGDPSGVFFKYRYRGNGVTCTGNESGFEQPSDGTPTGEKESDCTKKSTDANGVEVFECIRQEVDRDPGEVDCNYGEVNGDTKCWPKTPSPSLTDKKVETKVETKTNADGSKDTKTTTTTTTTNCTGVGACSTTVTTNVSNNKTNADGSDGGSSSECKGPGCKNGGDGSNTPKDEEKEEQPGSSVTGDSACAAAPACEGDAVQCAILRQTHKSRCDQEEFQSLEADKVAEATTALTTEFAGAEYQPLTAEEGGRFDLSNLINTSSAVSGSCPALPSISLSINGQSKTFSFSEWLAEVCRYAAWFGYLMVAFAMRHAIEIVARGFN